MMISDYLQNIILVTAVIVAVVGVIQNRTLARQKVTLSFLLEYNDSQETTEAIQILKKAKDNRYWYKELSDDDKHAVKFLLNKFEILAIGLEKNIYDNGMIDNAFGADLIMYYHYAEQFIEDLKAEERRSGTAKDMPFEHFEKLAKSLRDRP